MVTQRARSAFAECVAKEFEKYYRQQLRSYAFLFLIMAFVSYLFKAYPLGFALTLVALVLWIKSML